ncbi:MAG TPA: 2-oxo-4-hydroxy-4-carboxy-5-ureidoimidazoline decarboxylase [Gemmatimonadaceae bacterium]
MTLAELNAMAPTDAASAFWQCCSSTQWASRMSVLRPFKNEAELYQAAESVWWELSSPDWLEAFGHHPRIGSRLSALGFRQSDDWAKGEQSGMKDAPSKIREELVRWNEQYERRFGFVFLICATGKAPGEMLAQMERRMNNEPAAELRVAAGEQAKITRLRLGKMISGA